MPALSIPFVYENYMQYRHSKAASAFCRDKVMLDRKKSAALEVKGDLRAKMGALIVSLLKSLLL